MEENKKIVKLAYYGNENGPFADSYQGKSFSDAYVVYDDNTTYRLSDYNEIKELFDLALADDDIQCLGYTNIDKYNTDYQIDKNGVEVDKTIQEANEEPAENDKDNRGLWAAAIGIPLAFLAGLGLRNNKKADTVPDPDPKTTTDYTYEQYELDEHYKYSVDQAKLVENLEKGIETINSRCDELGIPNAKFNLDEALIFSLMMSDVSNEEAARYCQTLGYTSEQMNEYYQSAVQKFVVIQNSINKDSDIYLLDNLLLKVTGQSDRLTDAENQQKLDRVLDALHGALQISVALNTADDARIDKVNGSIELPDGKVVTFKDIIEYDFALLKSNEATNVITGEKVFSFASNASVRKVFLDAIVASHLVALHGVDDYDIAHLHVDANIPNATVQEEYEFQSRTACANAIDFDEVGFLIREGNDKLVKDVIAVTGNGDVIQYRDGHYGKTYDKDIENLKKQYTFKTWNELTDEEQIELLHVLVNSSNKFRINNDFSKGSPAVTPAPTHTETVITKPANEVISEEKTGEGVTEEEAKQDLEEKREEEIEKAKEGAVEVTEEEDGTVDIIKEHNDDGSGKEEIYSPINEDGSYTSTEVEYSEIHQEVETNDDDLTTQDYNGNEEHYDSDNVVHDYEEQEEGELSSEDIDNAKAETEAEEKKTEEENKKNEETGANWEAYFDELFGDGYTNEDTNTTGTTVETEEGDTEYIEQDHGPIDDLVAEQGNQKTIGTP